MSTTIFVRKLVAFVRGHCLALALRVTGKPSIEAKLRTDLETLHLNGSTYSAFAIARYAGIEYKEAAETLKERSRLNKQRWAERERRRKEAELAAQS